MRMLARRSPSAGGTLFLLSNLLFTRGGSGTSLPPRLNALNQLNELKEPNRLHKLQDATFSPCSNKEPMLISDWNTCATLTN